MDLIKLTIKGISFSQSENGAYALLLEEEIGERKLPVIIGSFEAQAIAVALESDINPPRPITHDLFTTVLRNYHISVKMVLIYKLKEGVFYSQLYCEGPDGEEHIFDSRTSDAIAMAVRFNAPIYTNKQVMEEAGVFLEIKSAYSQDEIQETLQQIEEQLGDILEDDGNFSSIATEELQKLLDEALEKEDYELAAQLRDELEKRN